MTAPIKTPFATSTGEFAVRLEAGTYTTAEIFKLYHAMVRAETLAGTAAKKAAQNSVQ